MRATQGGWVGVIALAVIHPSPTQGAMKCDVDCFWVRPGGAFARQADLDPTDMTSATQGHDVSCRTAPKTTHRRSGQKWQTAVANRRRAGIVQKGLPAALVHPGMCRPDSSCFP
eukprot:EG_transcript_25519